jgi:hypothetical protein
MTAIKATSPATPMAIPAMVVLGMDVEGEGVVLAEFDEEVVIGDTENVDEADITAIDEVLGKDATEL